MLLFFTLFLLIYQADDLQAAKLSAVDFSVVKQGPIKDPGCIPLFAREITFRIKNRSDRPIYIPGLRSDSEPYPLGNLMRFDREKNQWVDEGGNASYRPSGEFVARVQASNGLDVYILRPGKSMTFQIVAHEVYIGSQVKRSIFISASQNEEPRMITSEEFLLR